MEIKLGEHIDSDSDCSLAVAFSVNPVTHTGHPTHKTLPSPLLPKIIFTTPQYHHLAIFYPWQ